MYRLSIFRRPFFCTRGRSKERPTLEAKALCEGWQKRTRERPMLEAEALSEGCQECAGGWLRINTYRRPKIKKGSE
jgi:hypothetical protein